MGERPLIVLLGDSLLMEGVAMSLSGRRRMSVMRMDACLTDVGDRLRSLDPELIVFELNSPRAPSLLSLLREQPGTPLMGLDLDCSQVIVLNSSRHLTRTMRELGHLVQIKTGDKRQAERRRFDTR